jgi:pyruvate dehydrogenase E2 component (dihydrolipoamide acetyltransferase)
MTDPSSIHTLTMPKWGLSMTEGKVEGWLVAEGDAIEPGMEVADVDTGKITGSVEVPPGMTGVLRRQVAATGEVLPVGALLAVVADASVADADIEALVTATMAAVQGGLVLTQARRDPAQLARALDAAYAHLRAHAAARA